jgi:hypothetical protein
MRLSCSSVSNVFFWVTWDAFREVQVWPAAGTYWRGSCVACYSSVCSISGSDVIYIADATALWMCGEWHAVLGAACFADREVAGFKFHVASRRFGAVAVKLLDCRVGGIM